MCEIGRPVRRPRRTKLDPHDLVVPLEATSVPDAGSEAAVSTAVGANSDRDGDDGGMSVDPRSIVLRPLVPVAHALERIRFVLEKAQGVVPNGPQPSKVIADYVVWVEVAEEVLGPLFRSDAVRLGLLTDRYWQIRDFRGASMRPFPAISAELAAQKDRLSQVEALLREGYGAFPLPDGALAVVPDTNALVHLHPFQTIDWPKHTVEPSVSLVIPLIVVDELDELSYRSRRVSDRAKRVLKDLQDLRGDLPAHEPVRFRKDGTTVQLLLDLPGHIRAPGNDTEILTQVERLTLMVDRPPVLVSSDMGMRLRANARGIDVRQSAKELLLPDRLTEDPPLSVKDDPS